MQEQKRNDASFRDPNGFVIESNGEIYRVLNEKYYSTYDTFMQSGLYKELINEKLILEHNLDGVPLDHTRRIKQVKIPLITYPYEWSFDMFKDAGLATLRCQELAYKHGMELQDASAYNIQFYNGRPVMIDITSFVVTKFTQWRAYRQFCEHFLAPLALMGKKDLRLSNLLSTYIDGIPLDLASGILPKSTFGSFGINLHIHAHAKMNTKKTSSEPQKMGMTKNLAMIDSLKGCINGIKCDQSTEWDRYYEETNYSEKAFKSKIDIVTRFINSCYPKVVIDLGANDGVFATLASSKAFTIALDIDPNAVNKMYRKNIDSHPYYQVQPLVCNLVNPSASIGWGNKERPGILQRIKEQNGIVLALALVHHLRITYGIPFDKQFELLADLTNHALVEYVPRDDSQVNLMMNGRDESIYTDFYRDTFEKAISNCFKISGCTKIEDSSRLLYEIHV